MARRALDDVKKKEIVAILAVGCSQAMAAKYVGCSSATIRREAERDPKFARQIRQAKGNMELGLIRNIRDAAKKEQYWRAAAWALERCFPERYARRSPDVITAEQFREIFMLFAERIVAMIPDEKRRQDIVKDAERLVRGFGKTAFRDEEAADAAT